MGSRPVSWKESCGDKDNSQIDNFDDVFGNHDRHLFHVLPPGDEFGFLHDAFEGFVVEHWEGLSLERAARPIHRIPARRFT